MKSKYRAIALFGPTAVGKTALTERVFSKGFEIINADSVQVYRGFDIGSAKPSKELMSLIPHHLVDIMDPHQQYTVGDFCKDSEALIKEINDRGNIPLITGGTAYYFKQLMYGPSLTPEADEIIRAKVNKLLKEKGRAFLYNELKELDIEAASKINENDVYRITRALEVIYQTGKKLSSFPISNTLRIDISFLPICLTRDKKELDERIARRVDIMFEDGLYSELKVLFNLGANSTWPAMQGIGYKEFLVARESGELSLSLLKQEIVRTSRAYAKRQMTFFNSFKEAHFVNADNIDSIDMLVKDFLNH